MIKLRDLVLFIITENNDRGVTNTDIEVKIWNITRRFDTFAIQRVVRELVKDNIIECDSHFRLTLKKVK